MPNLVVYVPAALWEDLEKMNLDDPKVEARRVMIGELERYVTGGQYPIDTDVPEAIVGAIVPGLEVRRTAPPPPDHFKPDFGEKLRK